MMSQRHDPADPLGIHRQQALTNLACVEQRIHIFKPSATMSPEVFADTIRDRNRALRDRRRLLKRHPWLKDHVSEANHGR